MSFAALTASSLLRRQQAVVRSSSRLLLLSASSLLNSSSSSSSSSSCTADNSNAAAAINQQRQSHQRRQFASDTTYKFGVSESNLDTVKSTLPLVAKAGTDFTQHFYKRMFNANPELLNVFNQTNQILGGQPKKLLKTVALAAQAAIDTGELPGEAIEGICQKHCALHVGPDAYDIVGSNILGTIEDLLTDNNAVLDAWGALYGDIANVFITREREINDKVASVPGSWSGRRKFVLEKKERISSVIKRFKFRPVDGEPIPVFEPGKFTTIWAAVDEEGPYGTYTVAPRHYTLNLPRDPADITKTMSISVKKEGLVSRMLHSAEEGSEWELSAPHGAFHMSGVESLWLEAADAPVIFLSGGVGITPVLAMLESIYVTRPATWLHAAQNGDVHAYRDRLREIAAVRAGELQRRVWYSDPLPEDGNPGGGETIPTLFNLAKYHYEGLMDLSRDDFPSNILHLDNPSAHYYMCGPDGFMKSQKESLINLGVDEYRIHAEGF